MSPTMCQDISERIAHMKRKETEQLSVRSNQCYIWRTLIRNVIDIS
jgi:hypothetical protein